jgi:hypothetical protein
MGVLKSVEPTGFLAFAPAFAGTIWADVNRRIIQNCPHGRGRGLSSPPVWFRLCRLRGRRYFARFQVTVPVPPADPAGTVYFSSSPVMTKERFWSVLSQFGNVALSMRYVRLLSASLTT